MLRTFRAFAALQRSSKSKVDPLFVARYARNDLEQTRFGLSTGRRLGGAVVRNRVRRRIREALRDLAPRSVPGWDVFIMARPPAATASYREVAAALERVLRAAGVLRDGPSTR